MMLRRLAMLSALLAVSSHAPLHSPPPALVSRVAPLAARPLLPRMSLADPPSLQTGPPTPDVESERSLKAAENAEIKAIGGPALLGTLIDPFLSLVDTLYVGRLAASSHALGAVASSSELFTLCLAVSLALRESASSTLARLFAADKPERARAFAARSLQLAFFAGVCLATLMGGPSAPWCVGLMGAPLSSPLHADALLYARVRAVALPAAITLTAAEGIFRGMGNTRAPLRAAGIAALINFILDPLLIARTGVAGAAAATAVAQVVACLLLLRTMRRELFTGAVLSHSKPDGEESEEGREVQEEPASVKGATRQLVGTSLATVIRSSSVIGTWVFIASSIGRCSPSSHHGVIRQRPIGSLRPGITCLLFIGSLNPGITRLLFIASTSLLIGCSARRR